MNDIQIDYVTLVEVMTEECQSLQSQLLAMKSKLRIYDKRLTEALYKVSELEKQSISSKQSQSKPSSRKKSVDTDVDGNEF